MEKLVKVSFDVETAKKIQSGEIDGKVATRDGRDARVIYWNKKGECPIVALISDSDIEVDLSFLPNGRYLSENKDHDFDLLIQVPEWATFKAGDLIDVGGDLYLINSTPKRCDMQNDKGMDDKGLHAKFVAKTKEGRLHLNFEEAEIYFSAEFTKATKEQRKKFIRLLNEDGSDKAKMILEKYFGIKSKPKYKDGDILLVRCTDGKYYVFVYKSGEGKTYKYCSMRLDEYRKLSIRVGCVCSDQSVSIIRYAAKEERQMLRDALIKDGRSEAKEYLAEFFKEEKYKDGDILYVKGHTGKDFVFIYKAGKEKTRAYCSVCLVGRNLYVEEAKTCCEDSFRKLRYATEAEKNILIEALKKSDKDAAKDYLKRFFNIESEHEFKPFDKVLVRDDDDDRWRISFFGFYLNDDKFIYCCLSSCYKQCIPYQGNEHLLGTTDNPE